MAILNMKRADAATLKDGQRFEWHGVWYRIGYRANRRMAIRLEPNGPDGQPGTSGSSPPMAGFQVNIVDGE